jgi:erythromycin esterase
MSLVKTSATGQFDFELSPGRYAFAVTSPTGFAFLEQEVAATVGPVVTLSSTCHPVHGSVTGEIALPATVRISRDSTSVGDRFFVPVTIDRGFVACLTDGAYTVQADGPMVSLPVPIAIPGDSTVKLVAYATSRVEEVPKDIRIAHADFVAFARSLSERKLIGLGEANHGTGDFYTYRAKLVLELASKAKLRSLLFEADAIGMLAIEDYVMGADVDIGKSVAALRFWITDIEENLAFLAEVRAHNARSAAADKLHVLGIDAQRVEPPVQFLLAHRVELKFSDREADLLTQVAPAHGAAFTKFPADDRSLLSALLDRLAAVTGPADLASPTARASIAARSIAYQLGYLGALGAVHQRDQAMAEIAAHIIMMNGSRQAALWAHSAHVARQPTGAGKSIGQFLADRFRDDYYPIAFLSYSGAGRAWDAGGKIGVIAHELGPTPPYNVESVIMKATEFTDAAWVTLDAASGPLKQWLATPRYVREFGSVYIAQDTQALRPFPAAISAVVVLRHAAGSTPTPTGVRTVTR